MHELASDEPARPLIELVVVYPPRSGKRKAMPRKRAKPRRETRIRDPKFLAFVHTQPRWCERTLPGHRCDRGTLAGVGEADHTGPRGTRQKSHDSETIHICKAIHIARDAKVGREWREGGVFYGWDRDRMLAWMREGETFYQERYDAHLRAIDEVPF